MKQCWHCCRASNIFTTLPRIFLAEKPSETFPSIFPKSCISEPRNVCITGNTGRDLAKLTKLAPNLKGSLFGTKTTITWLSAHLFAVSFYRLHQHVFARSTSSRSKDCSSRASSQYGLLPLGGGVWVSRDS